MLIFHLYDNAAHEKLRYRPPLERGLPEPGSGGLRRHLSPHSPDEAAILRAFAAVLR